MLVGVGSTLCVRGRSLCLLAGRMCGFGVYAFVTSVPAFVAAGLSTGF